MRLRETYPISSKRYATRVIQDITNKVATLLEFPCIGRIVPEIGEDNVREISMYSYRIINQAGYFATAQARKDPDLAVVHFAQASVPLPRHARRGGA
ncbi:MAG: type II toxin-antitoxin system RelE/ParE family toxin, partial [Methylococcaceae bacterium]